MKKLISVLCIAAVSVTFSYTDIAEARNKEARNESYSDEAAFLRQNTRFHGQKATKNRKDKKSQNNNFKQKKNKKHHKKDKENRRRQKQQEEKETGPYHRTRLML